LRSFFVYFQTKIRDSFLYGDQSYSAVILIPCCNSLYSCWTLHWLGSPFRFMLKRSSLVECVSVLHGTCLQCAEFFFIHQYVQPCLSKNSKYTFYTTKSSLTLAYYQCNVQQLQQFDDWMRLNSALKKSRPRYISAQERILIHNGKYFHV
jgi:hypothetical protein